MQTIKKLVATSVIVASLLGFAACGGSSADGTSSKSEEESITPVQDDYVDIDVSADTDMAETVNLANRLANGVQAYFNDGERSQYIIENRDIRLTHNLTGDKFVKGITPVNSSKAYLVNTMDVYVTKGPDTYYAKDSAKDGRINTVKLGYYYYETNLRDLVFDSGIPLCLDKTYNVYPDKLHQEFGLVATSSTGGVDKAGFEIKVKSSDVNAIEIYDGDKTYSSATDGFDGKNVQYVALDIKGVGVIGIIVPEAENDSVSVNVTSKYYIIRQEMDISGLTFERYGRYTFGNRLYTDQTHSFSGISKANKVEHSPLTDANITVDESADSAKFLGYNKIKGCYDFNIAGMGFVSAYYDVPQKKFYEHITVKGVDDRTAYLRVRCDGYPLEGACLIDENDLQLPVPMQVTKNFGHEKEEPIYDPNDPLYGESYFPLAIKKNTEHKFSVVHVMKSWGEFDLKQLSSISFYVSYYHLSTGVTESTCIAPYYTCGTGWVKEGWILPDFRGCSEAFWGDLDANKRGDPQYGSVGEVYTPLNESGIVTSVYRYSDIISAGLTHADIEIHYVSSDNKYEYTIRQVEMPQNDENRVYYTISMKFLEDTEIDNGQFSLIGFNSRNVSYLYSAYLDENGEHQAIVNPTANDSGKLYGLNSSGSYFTYYGISGAINDDTGENIMDKTKDVGNFAVIVKDCDITVNGSSSDDVGLAFSNSYRSNKNYGSLTLSKNVAFKKGDEINLNLVLLPYGLPDQKDCQNVLNVYEDTLVNAISLTAENGNVVEDVWIPTVKANNNTAQFTLNGGVSEKVSEVNYAVKITDCTVLRAPKIQEFVDGQWVDYDYATEIGFDGYSVAVENGTLTYSFVFKQSVSGRTFRFSL